MNPADVALMIVVSSAATTVQGTVGFGAALVAAPLLALVDPRLVPGPISMMGIALGLLLLTRERGGAHWEAIRWPAIGLIPGSVAGAGVVRALAGTDALTIFLGLMVLAAVTLSILGAHPRRQPPQLLAGGAISGFMATSAGIGGPPIALFFQHASGPEIRGALSRFFILSSAVAIALLATFDAFGWEQVRLGLWLLPGVLVGFVVSGLLTGHVDAGRVRVAVLTLSSASAVLTIARAVAT